MAKKIGNFATYALLLFWTAISLGPFLWMATTAFKTRKNAFLYPPQWIPRPFTLENFERVWNTVPFGQYLLNTVFVTVTVLIFQLLFSSMAAYGFSRIRFPGREFIFVMFLGSMMIPPVVTMIPVYIFVKSLGWLDTFKAVIIPAIFSGTAFGVFFLRQFYLGIPKDLEDSACIDGAGVIRTFTTIIIPSAKPALTTIAVITFVGQWNQFLWPLVVINTPTKHMISVGLANLQGQFSSDWTGIMAGSLLTVIPILIIFSVAQKYFVQSIQLSGLK